MKTETTLHTMGECFRPGSGVYFGERADWLVAATVHRESDCLQRSNWRVMLAKLGGESESVQIERASCSLVGWIDRLLVDPADHARVKLVTEATEDLEVYPVLDEDDFSTLEYEEYYEFFRRDAASTIARELRREEFSERVCDAVESADADCLIEWFESLIPSGEYQLDGYPQFDLALRNVDRDAVARLLRAMRRAGK
jgi:hypothetical protein